MRQSDKQPLLAKPPQPETGETTEKLATLHTEDYLRERSERGSVARAKRILKKAGKGNAPARGDEVD